MKIKNILFLKRIQAQWNPTTINLCSECTDGVSVASKFIKSYGQRIGQQDYGLGEIDGSSGDESSDDIRMNKIDQIEIETNSSFEDTTCNHSFTTKRPVNQQSERHEIKWYQRWCNVCKTNFFQTMSRFIQHQYLLNTQA